MRPLLRHPVIASLLITAQAMLALLGAGDLLLCSEAGGAVRVELVASRCCDGEPDMPLDSSAVSVSEDDACSPATDCVDQAFEQNPAVTRARAGDLAPDSLADIPATDTAAAWLDQLLPAPDADRIIDAPPRSAGPPRQTSRGLRSIILTI